MRWNENDKKVRDAYMTYEMRMKDLCDEAHAEEKAATAKRLLSMGLSVEDIAKATSLSVEQVEVIKAEQI